MKQTCSIHTVNTNHESITVVRHTSPSKGWQALQQLSRSTVAQHTQHRARAPGAESPLSNSFTWSWTAIYHPQTVVLTGRKKLNQILLLQTFKAESWQQLCYQNKRDRGRPTQDSLQQQLMRQCQASTQGLSRVQSEIGAGGGGGGRLKIFITAQTLPST